MVSRMLALWLLLPAYCLFALKVGHNKTLADGLANCMQAYAVLFHEGLVVDLMIMTITICKGICWRRWFAALGL